MKYIKAEKILPSHIIETIQDYIDGEYLFFLIISLFCSILSSTALAIAPYLTKLLFGSISKGDNIQLIYLIIIYIACNLLSLALSYVEMLYNWKASIKFEMSLKQDFFAAITNYSYKRFSSNLLHIICCNGRLFTI